MSNTSEGHMPAAFIFGTSMVMVTVIAVIFGKELFGLEPALAKRMVGIAIGVMLVLGGNYFSKFGLFRAFTGGSGRKTAAAELMAGRVLCVAGIVIIAIWAFATIQTAPLGAALIGLAAFFLALASWLSLKPGAAPSAQAGGTAMDDTQESRIRHAMQSALLHILHAIAWVSVMLLADSVWGDPSRLWTVIGFVLSSGLLTVLMNRKAGLPS